MKKIIILDAEMTNIRSNSDELLQLSIIDNFKNILFNEYFKPIKNQNWIETYDVHGITPDFVKDKLPFSSYREEIQGIIDNADTIIGYSVDVDLKFLQNEKIKIKDQKILDIAPWYAAINNNWSDFFQSFKLKSLNDCAEFFNYDWNKEGINAHNSLGDCFATLYCYNKLTTPQIYKVIDYKIEEWKQDIFDQYKGYFDDIDLDYIIKKAIDCPNYGDYKYEIDTYDPLFDNYLLGEGLNDIDDIPFEELNDLYDEFIKENISNLEDIYYFKDIDKIRILTNMKNELNSVVEKESLLEKAPISSYKTKDWER